MKSFKKLLKKKTKNLSVQKNILRKYSEIIIKNKAYPKCSNIFVDNLYFYELKAQRN